MKRNKRNTLLCSAGFLAIAMLTASCAEQKNANNTDSVLDAGTKVYCFKDSCEHLTLSVSLELPLGEDSASMQIRDSLIADFTRSASQPGYSEDGTPQIKPFEGDGKDAQSIVDYYGKAGYDKLLSMAMSDYDDRIKFLDEDTTMLEEDKERIRKDIPMWAFDLNVSKTTDTLNFVVYDSQIYCYYGGAHGGITGTGSMTFSKETGSKVEQFIKTDATASLQKLIRKGLIQYYREAYDTINDKELSERLQIEGTMIPQPQRTPCLNATGDSLIFTYGQYEIACYADGMPSFILPVKDLTPYLTPEGKALIDKAQMLRKEAEAAKEESKETH